MKTGQITIRPGRLPEERPLFESYIDKLQAFEAEIEPNRRLDATVASEFFEVQLDRIREKDGRIFVAEKVGAPIGWVLTHLGEEQIYVREEDRTYGLISELYLDEQARGLGAGKMLVEAAVEDFRARGLRTVYIGVLARNERARAVYEAAGFDDYAIEMRMRI